MQFEVKNAPLPVLICKLEAGESVECQKGAISWMTASMKMETNLGSGGAGLFTVRKLYAALFPYYYLSKIPLKCKAYIISR